MESAIRLSETYGLAEIPYLRERGNGSLFRWAISRLDASWLMFRADVGIVNLQQEVSAG